ncbi:hypothetical protein EGO51_13230 [Haloarcula hispanica]|uniref:Uncharacterized protein n=1 Tax=Haloarcula hispanica TaxID=51589 RepID=A0A5J5LMR9_HALHI|nr:hypothetical protein [Haloarcula hispanica]KAA9410723.1 hypothetical protein EGO51_13230 [Haloarcula hispanica]
MSNLFYFRDKEGYSPDDKIDRIKRQYVSLEIPEIREAIRRSGANTAELEDPSKSRLIGFLRTELDTDEFSELINSLFDKYGERGDSFNIKSHKINIGLDVNQLVSNLNELEQQGLLDGESDHFSYIIELDDYIEREEQGVIDISFVIRGKREHIESDQVQVRTTGGEQLTLDELADEEVAEITKTEEYLVESRIYHNAGIVALSNSSIDKSLHEEILSGIKRWGTK